MAMPWPCGGRGKQNEKGITMNKMFSVGLSASCLIGSAHATLGQVSVDLDVMTFNVWGTETSASGRAAIVNAINASGADVVGFQEMNDASDGQLIANALGGTWNYYNQGGKGVLSRYRVVDVATNNHGVQLEFAPGHEAWVFNVHLPHAPYGPYQLNGIPYHGGTLYDPNKPSDITAVIQDQKDARGAQMDAALASMQTAGALDGDTPVFLTGDFNEASHLDWTAKANAAGVHVAEVAWPTSIKLADAGLKDSWRSVHPNEVADLGNTWSPILDSSSINNGKPEPQDRIDLVYFGGTNVSAIDSRTVGPTGGLVTEGVETADYGSDHNAVVSTMRISGLQGSTLTFSGLAHNPGDDSALNHGYADHASTTPNVEVSFSASSGDTWDTYTGGNWNGVGQLQYGGGAASYDATFAPDSGFGVILSRFELLDWETGDGHTVTWELLGDNGSGQSVLRSNTVSIGAGKTLLISTGMTEAFSGNLTLRLTHQSGAGDSLAIDHIAFDQVAVPEPTTLSLAFALTCLGMRRQSRTP